MTVLKTALHQWHADKNGRMVDFAGWEMPIQYSSIVEEHNAVRKNIGLFDVGHMGRLVFTGPDACRLLDTIITNNVESMSVGQIRYALVTNEQGFVLDDILVYKFEEFYLLVVNASNRVKIVDHIKANLDGFDVEMNDITTDRFMMALQGPKSEELLNPLVDADLSAVKYYHSVETKFGELPVWVTRTGYTGEDGFEIIVNVPQATEVWETLMEKGQPLGIFPAGLGCRDTLRLEAAMPLYGHELNEETDPFTAGLGFAVKLKKPTPMIGKEALEAFKISSDRKVRVGLEIEGRRITREHSPILSNGEVIGEVTSGTFSPTMQKVLAMGYVPKDSSELGTSLEIELRGKMITAKVVPLPFYKRK